MGCSSSIGPHECPRGPGSRAEEHDARCAAACAATAGAGPEVAAIAERPDALWADPEAQAILKQFEGMRGDPNFQAVLQRAMDAMQRDPRLRAMVHQAVHEGGVQVPVAFWTTDGDGIGAGRGDGPAV
ncbi:unnamed protein product [Prorocentrum cordatum]|uniref:Uncharacterized protein n=1 Tax=Prorocentrum cordatum TaxID=2364126 RepID=A0ABN9U3F8_9DINO|nr:unnamed protein product [Polarella glacialis]